MSGGDVRDRLARLLADRAGDRSTTEVRAADTAAPPEEPREDSREAPRDVRAALRVRAGLERTSSAREVRAPIPPRDLELDACARVLARRTSFDPDHRHGAWSLAEAVSADPRALSLLARDPALAGIDLSRALFLDTETTGLSGGAGTYVFLVGLGRFEPRTEAGPRFGIWQGFLADPAEERALLEEVAARIRGASAVVSFFGKSFDRHRLEDKMRLHGVEPPFAGRPHLDLYHPLRRLYRPRQAPGPNVVARDARLKTLELELCGVDRPDDLPGARAPAAWFDFLHGRPHELEGVFRHNLDDVLSLVALAAHLARTLEERRLCGETLSGSAADRARGIAAALAGERDLIGADLWFERATERGAGSGSKTEERLRRRARRAVQTAAAPVANP